MNFRFLREAREEYLAAIRFYREIDPELGKSFVKQVDQAIRGACRQPFSFPLVEFKTRRSLVKQFPFGVFFVCEPDRITIWAVMHLSRKPGYWKKRRP